jgi:1-acyl-sn-glycerol-3-phosphate acyltransferase
LIWNRQQSGLFPDGIDDVKLTLPERLRLTGLALGFAALTLPLLPVQWLVVRFDWPLQRAIPVFWHRCVLRLLGIRVSCHGAMEPRHPMLIVANHVSWLDIIVFASIGQLCFIAKSEVREWPLFGLLARLQRSVFVERGARGRSGDQVNEIAERLLSGDVMVLFAEGTTGDGNQLLEFKSSLLGAAQAALKSSPAIDAVVVQPVAIAYTGLQGLPLGRQGRRIISWLGDDELVPNLLGILNAGPISVEIAFGKPRLFTEGGDRKALTRTIGLDIKEMAAAMVAGRDPIAFAGPVAGKPFPTGREGLELRP